MRKSFTLVELLIGIAIFILLLVALQSFIGAIFSSSFRALSMKRLADSTRTSLEIMGREMRLATNPGPTGSSCGSGLGAGVSFKVENSTRTITFLDFQGRCIVYNYDNTASQKVLTKSIDAGTAADFLGNSGLPKEVSVDALTFTLLPDPIAPNPPTLPTQQPRITINITVSTQDPTAQGQRLKIDLQTTVSQREL